MEKTEKESKNKSRHLGFLSHNILATLKVYTKFQDSGSHRSQDICDRKFDWKEKWTNKGNDKQEEADSLLHNTRCHTQHLYQISKS